MTDFDFTLDWRAEAFALDSIALGDNPLGLTGEQLTRDPGRLRVRRDPARTDTVPYLPFGTVLMDLCFTPTAVDSRSVIDARRVAEPYFATVDQDSLFDPAPNWLLSGDLFVPGQLTSDTVGLALVTHPDRGGCVDLTARNFNAISSFTTTLRWPDGYRLDSVTYPTPGFDTATLSVSQLAPDEASLAYQPADSSNVTLTDGTVVARLCFGGFASACEVATLAQRGGRDRTVFRRRFADLNGEVEVDRRLDSTLVYAPDGGPLRLRLDSASVAPGERRTTLGLYADGPVCVEEYDLQLAFDPAFALRWEEATVAPALADSFTLERIAGHNVFRLRYAGAGGGRLPAGRLATLHLRRVGSTETDTVAVRPRGLRFDSLLLTRPDGTPVATPVFFRPGRVIFRDTTSATTTEPAWAAALRLFPNPTGGPLTVRGLPADGRTRAVLYDLTGRRLRNFPRAARIDLGELPAGTYWLRLVRPGGRVLRKVVRR